MPQILWKNFKNIFIISTPFDTNKILDQYINHEITDIKAAKLISVSRVTFFRLVKERKQQIKQQC